MPAENELELVSVGHPVPGFEIEIRNEDGQNLPQNHVGRIWARGPSVMKGYLNNPEATSRALHDDWLDTGDLGFVHQGELFISGRAKDILIVRGQNHAPEEIEMVVDEVPGVRVGCRAAVNFMPAEAEREEVWLFVERHKTLTADQICTMAQNCAREVAARTAIQLDRVEVLEPGTLPRTSSGKIRRAETLRQFLAGELTPPERVTTGYLLRAMGKSLLSRSSRQPWAQPAGWPVVVVSCARSKKNSRDSLEGCTSNRRKQIESADDGKLSWENWEGCSSGFADVVYAM